MNLSWSCPRQTIPTASPAPAQPPLAPKLLLWSKIASAPPQMEPDSPPDRDTLRRLFFSLPWLQPVLQDPQDGTV